MPKGKAPSQGLGGSYIEAARKTPAWKQRQLEQEKQKALKLSTKRPEREGAATPQQQLYNSFMNPSLPNPSASISGMPTFYQVKPEDKSMDDIALRHNLPLQYLTDLNKTKTLPPKGSYIQLQPAAGSLNAALGLSYGSNAFAGSSQIKIKSPASNRDDFYTRHSGEIQAAFIQRQFSNGQLPKNIPSNALAYLKDGSGMPITPQDLKNIGYVMNNQGVYVQSGAAAPATSTTSNGLPQPSAEFMGTLAYQTGTGAGVDFLNQLRYDPQTKKYKPIKWFLKTGKLDIRTGYSRKGNIHKGRGREPRPRPFAPAAPVLPPDQITGPTTILDIHLGSG